MYIVLRNWQEMPFIKNHDFTFRPPPLIRLWGGLCCAPDPLCLPHI